MQNPMGQSLYDVIAVAIDPEHAIAKNTGTSMVIFCKEQILEWIYGGKVTGWPTATISLHGFETRGDGGYGDARDQKPQHDWVTLRMEEEIERRRGLLQDAARVAPGTDDSAPEADDEDMDPVRNTSLLSRISEEVSPHP